MGAARSVVTSALTYVEMRAALARMAGQRRLGREAHEATLRRFTLYWGSVAMVPVDDALIARAAELAEEHFLRACDAVQLASALVTTAREPVVIGAWDRDLNAAARREGLALIDPGPA